METIAINQNELTEQERDRQIRYDLETQFSELVDGNMRTDFELRFTGDDLIGEDDRSLTEITSDAIAEAEEIVRQRPELSFEPPRRDIERKEIQEAIAMAKGDRLNTMVVVSDFPKELLDAKEDVGGYNVTRQQTMLRVILRQPDGNLRMFSQSLDGSNRQALETLYERFGITPEPGDLLGQRIHLGLNAYDQDNLVDNLVGLYDNSLSNQYGGEWYAGRRPADLRNTYDFVRRQHDLIETCIQLQREGQLDARTMYNVAATMQARFEQSDKEDWGSSVITRPEEGTQSFARLQREIESFGDKARIEGLAFSSCGGTLRPEGSDDSTENDMERSGYGNKSVENGDCDFISKECPVCHAKDVKTRVRTTKEGKKHVTGDCGCSKTYNADDIDD